MLIIFLFLFCFYFKFMEKLFLVLLACFIKKMSEFKLSHVQHKTCHFVAPAFAWGTGVQVTVRSCVYLQPP